MKEALTQLNPIDRAIIIVSIWGHRSFAEIDNPLRCGTSTTPRRFYALFLLQQLNQLRPNPRNFNTGLLRQKVLELKQSETLTKIHPIKEYFLKKILNSKQSSLRWHRITLVIDRIQPWSTKGSNGP